MTKMVGSEVEGKRSEWIYGYGGNVFYVVSGEV